MDEKTWLYYSRNAEQLHRHNPIDLTKIYAQDYDEWAAEALQLSIDTVYDGFVEGEEPSLEYLERARNTIETRMMYGG